MNTRTSDHVHVYLRFCPITDLEDASENYIEVFDDNTRVRLNCCTSLKNDGSQQEFVFDQIFDCLSTQSEIYEDVGFPLVKEFLLGNNCCILTYGEVDTGKTHTILGSGGYNQNINDDISSLSSYGVSEAPLREFQRSQMTNKLPPRLLTFPDELRDSFNSTKKPVNTNVKTKHLSPIERMMNANKHINRGNTNIIENNNIFTPKTRDSYSSRNSGVVIDGLEDAMERTRTDGQGILPLIMKAIFDNIFNEIVVKFAMYEMNQSEIRDLLGSKDKTDSFEIKRNINGVFVEGITQVGCTTKAQVLGLIERGIENRNTFSRANSGLNFYHRSHTVFELTSEYYDRKSGTEMTNTFRIVDTAGFDHILLDSVDGPQRKMINESVDALRNVVFNLADAQQNIPYSDSTLTHILQDRLSGDCKTSLLITASSSYLHESETLQTLEFGKQMRKIVKKDEIDDEQLLATYKAKLELSERTKHELMEVIIELDRNGIKLPRRKSSNRSMTSILEEDEESLSSLVSEKLSMIDREKVHIDLNDMEKPSGLGAAATIQLENDLVAAREELKNVSALLQSASAKMDMDVNLVKKLSSTSQGSMLQNGTIESSSSQGSMPQNGRNLDLTSEEIDANIEAAKKSLDMTSNILPSNDNVNIKEMERKLEEKEALLAAKEEELLNAKELNEDLFSKVKKQEDDLMVANTEIEALTHRTKALESSLRENSKNNHADEPKKYRPESDFSYNPAIIPDDQSLVSRTNVDKTDSMRVCLRIRPMSRLETSRRSRDCITVHEGCEKFTVDSPLDGKYEFTYDKVFPTDATQSIVYEYVGVPIVNNLLSGINCCLIAYGIKHSGKTTTLFGSSLSAKDHFSNYKIGEEFYNGKDYGVLPRVVREIFSEISKKDETQEFTIRCSFVAIYLEKLFDLLDPGAKKSLYIDEDEHKVCIRGACSALSFNESEIYALILRGRANYNTLANQSTVDIDYSSLIFIIEIEQRNSTNGTTKNAQLQVVDIFAYDSMDFVSKSSNANEAKLVQQSFSTLGQVINSLSDKEANVPYGDTKLTYTLKNAFGGNCKTTLIVTASPSLFHMSTTVKAFQFGQEVRAITNNPRVNYEFSTNFYKKWLIECETKLGELSGFVVELAQELCLKEQFSKLLSTELWKSIASIAEEAVLWNPCREAMTNGEAENYERLGQKWKALSVSLSRRFNSYEVNRDEDDVEQIKSFLSDIQCELHVLKTQNKLLRNENQSKSDSLQSIDNELKSTKLEISIMAKKQGHLEFKEKLAVSILLHLRKLCWRMQSDLTQNRSAEIITLISSIKGLPDLSGLVDIDTLLLDFGFISSKEIDNDSEVQAFLNDVRSLYDDQSSRGPSNFGFPMLKNIFPNFDDQSKSDNDTKSSSRFRKRPIRRQQGDFESITEYTDEMNESRMRALSQVNRSKSENEVRKEDIAEELRQMTRKCIDLTLKLSEEQSILESVANRGGPLMRNNLTQEVIKLRRENDNLLHDLKAAGWKLHEIHVVNEFLETQAIESKRQITFLENDFRDLQNIFKETMAQSHEKESQLTELLREKGKRIAPPFDHTEIVKLDETNEQILPKMNILPKGLSSSTKMDKNDAVSKSNSFNSSESVTTQIAKIKMPEKIPCKKFHRKTKYSRRSRKHGDAIAGSRKKKLLSMHLRSKQCKLPIFEGIIDI